MNLIRRRRPPARAGAILPGLLLALLAGRADAAQWFVETNGVEFSPQFITIAAGDSVTFLNRGGYHNVVADDGSFRCAHGCDGDGKGGSGNPTSALWIASVTFPKAGTIGYFCEPHGAPGSGMYGTIEVLAPAKPVTPAPGGGVLLEVLLGAALIAGAMVRLRRHQPHA
jgi:plastocyanin